MKTFLLSIVLFAFAGYATAQDIPASQVPVAIVKAFKLKFPRTSKVEWEMKGNLYEAEFKVDRREYKALYDAAGKLQTYKREISPNELPAAVRNAIATQYKGFHIDDADRLEKNGKVYYQVDLDGKPHDEHVVFNANGTVANDVAYW
ncbi:Putative beta-lactamase-inhibitor-like, PepSY-like [Chitinophaga jiangningensis]|uniref:Putative beta-lactamase-inhibitor-like, PepSY-like n=1 Tax=Chitinophaga jiangningensis TaxID=1419482 RepID=A0A1M7L6D2_9BACT|nr:PepSY-like domain-containing protein [Chitinophaga jiangningensis]SHM73519.1 Putative beta-lactamase-inhibitor-like, PepSY-like [Chitinophaga jiangningensis]